MKTAELTGALLDYWVARASGCESDMSKIKPGGDWCAIEPREAHVAAPEPRVMSDRSCAIAMVPNAIRAFPACILGHKIGRGKHPCRSSWFYPSTVWNHGGPIIEREGIAIQRNDSGTWNAGLPGRRLDGYEYWAHCQYSMPTPLIAAMRVYVTSKFGAEVPDEVRP